MSISLLFRLALLLPITAILVFTAVFRLWSHDADGEHYALPISGFDPRGLLSGHYLSYRVNYLTDKNCLSNNNNEKQIVCMSSQPRVFLPLEVRDRCRSYIVGYCEYGSFMTGVEKFHVSEQRALESDQVLRSTQGMLYIKVKEGIATIEKISIDDILWKPEPNETAEAAKTAQTAEATEPEENVEATEKAEATETAALENPK